MIDIDNAVEQFRQLLNDQIKRKQKIENDNETIDFSKKEVINIGIIDGDGIGPIIMKEAVKVLKILLEKEIENGTVVLKKIDGLTIERRLATGQTVPEDVMDKIRECDVILKGPTTTPKGGNIESANVYLRRELDLFANVRPVKIPEKNIDWIFFRENTEGEYVLGSKGIDLDGMAVDFKIITKAGTERIARMALQYARDNGKTNVAIVTKANILKKTDGSFSDICHKVAEEFPGIVAEDWYVDIMAANLIDEKVNSRFQVFVLPNLYGDILTDEAAQIQGGVGTAGSGNIGKRYAMFEAIHGTGLRMFEEKREIYANPSSILRAVEMMLRHISRIKEADKLSKVLDNVSDPDSGIKITGYDDGLTCERFGDHIVNRLRKKITE